MDTERLVTESIWVGRWNKSEKFIFIDTQVWHLPAWFDVFQRFKADSALFNVSVHLGLLYNLQF